MSTFAIDTLQIIFPAIRDKLSGQYAHNEQVREGFQVQLDKFFVTLMESLSEQDMTLLDDILDQWVHSRTGSDLKSSDSLSPLFDALYEATLESAQTEMEEPAAAIRLLREVHPYYRYAANYISSREVDAHIAYIKEDLENVRASLVTLERSKSDFISVAAHELKTPLTLIDGYAAMLTEEIAGAGDSGQAAQLIEGIRTGTRRLQAIINDMIDVSLIDNDMLSVSLQPVWINQILTRVYERFKPTADGRQIDLEIHLLQGQNILLRGDPARLQQVFVNLLTNAVKFTPDGGRIDIRSRLLSGFLEVVITDSGIGIDPEYHELIFDKFSRVGSPILHSSGRTKFKGGGPGLGLPIAKGIVEAHGGTIYVESPGYNEDTCPGSSFHVLLPMEVEDPEEKLSNLLAPYDIKVS